MSASQNRFPAVSRVLTTGLLAIVLSHGVAVGEEAGPSTKPDFRTVDFDGAMKHQIVRSMPLKLAFPADYDMLVLDPAINGVVWARRADLDHIAKTKEVPPGAGMFHGRLTTRVGYDSASNSFICGPGCDEKKLQASIKASGADVVRWQKRVVNGIPMLLIEMGTDSMPGAVRKKLYMAYIAVLIDTNVMLISYSPPSDSKDDGETAWQAFTGALTAGTVTVEPARSQTPSIADDFAQSTRSAAFRPIADAFIAAAAAGDETKSVGLMSPRLLEAVGRQTVQNGLTGEVLPFFATLKALGNSQTIAPIRDRFGNDGFVFYLSMTPKEGAPRKFAIYVVEENGTKVVASVAIDHDFFRDSSR